MAVLPSVHSISLFRPKIPTPKSTFTPNAELFRPHKMRVPFKLKDEQNRIFHQLPSGLQMEVIVQKGSPKSSQSMPSVVQRPPLLFLHGSYHAAWSWAEHWLPFFSASGFDCYAVSLLGQVGLPLYPPPNPAFLYEEIFRNLISISDNWVWITFSFHA